MKRTTIISIVLVIAGLLLSVPVFAATWGEVGTPISSLPYTINQPGLYFITGDLTSNMYGIAVYADNVTIDLKGHSIIGPDTPSGITCGVYLNGRKNVEIRNGTIRNFEDGICDTVRGKVSSHRVIDARIIGNRKNGIRLESYQNIVRDSTVSNNGANGIFTGAHSIVSGNTATGNAYDGIHAASGSLVKDNTANTNGYNGISVDNYAAIMGNTTMANGQSGIKAPFGVSVKDNTAGYNQLYGIYLTFGTLGGSNLVDGNTAVGNNQSGGGATNISPCYSCTFGTNSAP